MTPSPASGDHAAHAWHRQEDALNTASPGTPWRAVSDALAEPLDDALPVDFAALMERRAYAGRGADAEERRESLVVAGACALTCLVLLLVAPASGFAWLAQAASGGWAALAAASLLLAACGWFAQRRVLQA